MGKKVIVVMPAYNAAETLEKTYRDLPSGCFDNIILVDAVDFGGRPGEYRVLEAEDLKTTNLFSTHNASLSLTINYLQNNLKVDIIILIIQPKNISFGNNLSSEVERALNELEGWLSRVAGDVKC